MMKKSFARLLAAIAMLATGAASMGCPWFAFDEPKASDSICD